MNPMDLKRGIDWPCRSRRADLKKQAKKVNAPTKNRPGRHDLANGERKSAT
jgi:hypothetical protein